MRRLQLHAVLSALAITVVSSTWVASADDTAPVPFTSSAQAIALADELGSDHTAGVYYREGRLVVAVTDQATAASVRAAGGTTEIVAHSMTELTSAQVDLDELAGIPNTSWGVDPSSNRVVVKVYDGVSESDRTRINEVASAHGDAVQVEKHAGEIKSTAYALRGGLGIVAESGGWVRTCSAGFNATANDGDLSTGTRYMLTAGHCMNGGYYTWNRRNGDIPLGTVADWEYEPGDWAVVPITKPDIAADGMVQYKDGTASQITGSRWAVDNETVKRVGTMSQDLVGMVLNPSVTVNYVGGVTLYNMIEASNCTVSGDSGGPLFTGTTALGLNSGGNYANKPCGDTDSQVDRASFYHPVQDVLNRKNLRVY